MWSFCICGDATKIFIPVALPIMFPSKDSAESSTRRSNVCDKEGNGKEVGSSILYFLYRRKSWELLAIFKANQPLQQVLRTVISGAAGLESRSYRQPSGILGGISMNGSCSLIVYSRRKSNVSLTVAFQIGPFYGWKCYFQSL